MDAGGNRSLLFCSCGADIPVARTFLSAAVVLVCRAERSSAAFLPDFV